MPVLSPKTARLASIENETAINCEKSEDICALRICMGKSHLAIRGYGGLLSSERRIVTQNLQISQVLWHFHFYLVHKSGQRHTLLHKHVHICRMRGNGRRDDDGPNTDIGIEGRSVTRGLTFKCARGSDIDLPQANARESQPDHARRIVGPRLAEQECRQDSAQLSAHLEACVYG